MDPTSLETLLRKYLWAFDLMVVVLCAVVAARATATMAESALMRNIPPSPPRRAQPNSPAAELVEDRRVEAIVSRNLFCSSCPPIALPAAPSAVVAAPARTTLPLKLLAVMYAPPPADPRWSLAIIRDDSHGTAGPYAIGSRLGAATVDEIDEVRVYLNVDGGRREYLDLLGGPPWAPGIHPGESPPAPDPLTAELDAGIKRTGEHRYEVRHATVESLLGKMGAVGALPPAARIVPEVRRGVAAGFRLLGVRPEGPFAKIGLLDGDVISSIGGLDLTSPDNALAIYAKLRGSDRVTVALERNGRSITAEYDLR